MPCVDQHIWALRWYFLPILLLSSTVVLVTAVMGNNIQRQYPKFWVAQIPPPPPAPKVEEKKMEANKLVPAPGSHGNRAFSSDAERMMHYAGRSNGVL